MKRPPFSLRANRRGFLKSAAATAAGLTIGFHWSGPLGRAFADTALADTAKDFAPNAFLRIAPDNSVTVIAKHLEMGQGSYTGLATVVAEELDADWAQIAVESAPADASKYANLAFGMQGHRRQLGDGEFLDAVAPGGRHGAGDAGCRCGSGMECAAGIA